MTESDDSEDFERRVRVMNKGHGYAGVFNYENSEDKRAVEEHTIEEWRAAIKAEFGIQVDMPLPNPNDPPDFFVTAKSKRLAVELVQMVDQEHKKRATKGETPFAGQLFLDMQWSAERLISELNEIIRKKGEKYKKAGIEIDVLLIHTAEIWLTSTLTQVWLRGANIEPHPSIRIVHLLIEYEPGRDVDHWPIFSLYGALP